MWFHLDYLYWVMLAPALLLGFWAQARVRSAFARAEKEVAPMTGAAAARYVLDSAGLQNVSIEQINGFLSDHYDPRQKVLRLSPQVYQGRSMAAVGIAAHESGHAIQDLKHYAPLVVRNAVVPVANFGGGISTTLLIIGFLLQAMWLVQVGIIAFSAVVFFQLVNLPVEFDASNRAKAQLDALGVVPRQDQEYVREVLNAAAWTYVAGTLQAVLTLLYFILRFGGGNRS
ncbi:MAG TPA: zinc metallopeptidase [Lacipirellulaceae bacterium]|nr:zinc metallopeptidase [Lacipirellulaceae bacterium]